MCSTKGGGRTGKERNTRSELPSDWKFAYQRNGVRYPPQHDKRPNVLGDRCSRLHNEPVPATRLQPQVGRNLQSPGPGQGSLSVSVGPGDSGYAKQSKVKNNR